MRPPGRDREPSGGSGNWPPPPASPRRSNPLTGVSLNEAEQRYIEGKDPLPSVPTASRRSRRRLTTAQVALLVALGLLLLGTLALVTVNLLFPDWRPHKPPTQAKTVDTPPAPASAAAPQPSAATPPPVSLAETPIAAVKLMLKASVAGDTRTAYAQWDIGPQDLATVKRGVQLTLAEQTEEATVLGSRLRPENYEFRLQSQAGAQARVGQYRHGVLTQVYSLRQVGSHWKLYNAAEPDR